MVSKQKSKISAQREESQPTTEHGHKITHKMSAIPSSKKRSYGKAQRITDGVTAFNRYTIHRAVEVFSPSLRTTRCLHEFLGYAWTFHIAKLWIPARKSV